MIIDCIVRVSLKLLIEIHLIYILNIILHSPQSVLLLLLILIIIIIIIFIIIIVITVGIISIVIISIII